MDWRRGNERLKGGAAVRQIAMLPGGAVHRIGIYT